MTRIRRSKDPTELSAAEWVRQQLIDDIVAGRLRPGEKLCEVKIAARLGCSRTPVREAFRHLGALGLAHFERNRGGNVVQLERAIMVELFEALAEVAASCAGLAALRPLATRRPLEDAARGGAAAAPAGTGGDDDLLSVLFRVAGNRVLAESGTSIRCRLLPYWRLLGEAAEGWAEAGAATQGRAVAAILSGDGAAARVLVRDLVLASRDLAVGAVPLSAFA
jgi:DNA-binding GntR family transcriptional regulator